VLEHEDIEEILRLLDATPLQEFELATDRFKITLRRSSGGQWTQEHQSRRTAAEAMMTKERAADGEPATYDKELVAGHAPAANSIDAQEIRAPLVGTFYRSPRPGAPPFVEPGTRVAADTVVAIVETMKLMTSIYAGSAGRIAEILIDDGQFVEQDQLLMRIISGAA
jgi:acetyl-CoA carboxylase biotin carboxyl carrier protein